jgi:hypothetical protein
MQHWIDRAGYWRERAEKAEAELEGIRQREGDRLTDDEAEVFYAVITAVHDGEVRLATDAEQLPPAGARVEVRVRWSPARP